MLHTALVGKHLKLHIENHPFRKSIKALRTFERVAVCCHNDIELVQFVDALLHAKLLPSGLNKSEGASGKQTLYHAASFSKRRYFSTSSISAA